MHVTLNAEEVQFLQKRQRDDIGRVFSWNGRIFRGVFPGREEHVRSMFSTGMLEELIFQDCFPETWITDYKMEGFSLVLEHRRIWPVVYPQDWTFSMLKDAALLVCKTALIAKTRGYNMRDCHGLNVLFDGVIPKFIDLGSFIPDKYLGWKPYEEFLRFYYYPLKIWQYNSFVAKLSIFSGNLTLHETYWKYRHPFFRRMSPRLLNRLIGWYLRPAMLASSPFSVVESMSYINKLFYKLIKKRVVVPESIDLKRLMNKVTLINQDKTGSQWGSYHENIKEKADRFDRIIEIINSNEGCVKSAIDLGGNQGKFSRQLLEKTCINEVVCIDSDENAIDAGYCQEKIVRTGKITFVHYDFMGGIVKLRFMLPCKRFECDLVIALALTHHLILSQGYDAEDICKNISAYARRYVIIEFMPLGLWVKGSKPNTPDWYTIDWFREAFRKYFDLVLEEKLRENNILFVGKVCTNGQEELPNG